jgi:N-acyl-D-aspartate/D-glutamate deacylase
VDGTFDTLIKEGILIDGTGNPPYRADMGISGGKISCIQSRIDQPAKRIIPATGMAVSPGFIDVHSHDDFYLLFRPTCDEKVLQGVTTTVVGNCGFSAAPVGGPHAAELMDGLRSFGAYHIPEKLRNFSSFENYLQILETVGPGINVLPLVGHNTIRIAVMGMDKRPPTDRELKEMKARVARAMEEGAFGFSTGLIYTPGTYTQTDEIIDLTRVAASFGGIYTSHLRSEGDGIIAALTEALRIGEETGVSVQVSHHKVGGRRNWGRSTETLGIISAANARGLRVTCDQYPYHAASTILITVLPPHLLAGGPEETSKKLKDPKIREKAIAEIEDDDQKEPWENLIQAAGFEGIIISSSPKHPQYIGKSLTAIAQQEGKNPYEVVFDLAVEEGWSTGMIIFSMAEEDIERIMEFPFTMFGSDGVPNFGGSRVHPRFAGTFPRVLSRYVRERRILGLEEAVRKMTSLPARTFQLDRKGILKEGWDADLVIFDPQRVADKATFEAPQEKPEGIPYVFVNGRIIVDQGRVTGEPAGAVLRRKRIRL